MCAFDAMNIVSWNVSGLGEELKNSLLNKDLRELRPGWVSF